MSVSSDSNTSAKEFEKLNKYNDLEIEIGKIWKMKTKTIPVIAGALGMMKKGTQKYVNEKFFINYYFTPKLYNFYTNMFIQLYTKFLIYNIYTIQIHHNNS